MKLRLYDYEDSGNGYKVRLLASLLGIELEVIEVDILAGEARTPEFLAMNPSGQIPLLRLESDEFLAESNAILCHLAEGTRFLPAAGLSRSRVLSWLFFEQNGHEPFVATARFIARHMPEGHARFEELTWRVPMGRAAIARLETALSGSDFLVGAAPTIADLALFAYTHRADEAGIRLDPFPSVRAWCSRLSALEGFLPWPRD